MFCGKLALNPDERELLRQKIARYTTERRGCRIWIRSLDAYGYGQLWMTNTAGDRDILKAHRAAYELARGPIPPDLTIDHLCANRACLNPEHLEVVPAPVNARRAAERRLFCKRGHRRSGLGRCLACARITERGRRGPGTAIYFERLKQNKRRYALNPEPYKQRAREHYWRKKCSLS